MTWNTACPNWAERLGKGLTPFAPDLPLNQDEARRAVTIFNRLRLPDVVGQPRLKVAAGDWLRDVVSALFGSGEIDPVTKARMIRELFVMVPKKNAKTTGGAAIMVTALLMNKRPRAEFMIVAPTQEVSEIAYRQAVGMIEADVGLEARFHVQEHLKKLTYLPTGASLKVKSFDPKIVTGSKPSGVLLDELHVIAERTDADRVLGQLRGGIISQPEAFILTITTQSERPPSGVFRTELIKARNVRDGITHAAVLPIIYEFPPSVDWKDTTKWWMVTPNRDKSISVDRLVADFDAIKAGDEGELRRWASQHLNIEIGLRLQSDRWAGADYWETADCPELVAVPPDKRLAAMLARCDVAVVGIDGGGLDDLLGIAVVGRDRATRSWFHWGHAWAHSVVFTKRPDIAARLRDFEDDGDLTVVERLGDDIKGVVAAVCQVRDAQLLPASGAVGLDPVGVGAIVDALAEEGISGDQVVGISQGWKMSGAIKTVERKVADGTFWHCGQGLLAWSVGNAKVEPKGNAVTITKQTAGSAKIDPLMAMFDAAALMSGNPDAPAGGMEGFLAHPVVG